MPKLVASQVMRLSEVVQRYFSREEVVEKMMGEIVPVIEGQYEAEKDSIATKDDMAAIGQNLREMLAALRTEIREQTSELIKWMFIFWAGSLAAMITLVLIYVRK